MRHPTPTLELAIAGQHAAPDTTARRYQVGDILALVACEPHAGRQWTRVITRGNRGGYCPRPLGDILGDLVGLGWRSRSAKVSDGGPILRDAAYQDDGSATVRLVAEDQHGQRLQVTWRDCASHLSEVRQAVEVSA